MSKNKKILVFCAIAVVLIAVIVVLVFAFSKGQEYYRFLEVREYSGSVAFERDGKNHELFERIHLVSKDKIITGAASDILLLADLDKHIFAEENTAFIIEAEGNETEGRIAINLLYGGSLFTIDRKLPVGSEFVVNSPNATLSVRGTVFHVDYDPETNTTTVEVTEGVVEVSSKEGIQNIEAGGSCVVKDGNIYINTDSGLNENSDDGSNTISDDEDNSIVTTTAINEIPSETSVNSKPIETTSVASSTVPETLVTSKPPVTESTTREASITSGYKAQDIANMLMDYVAGKGKINKEMLANVKRARIWLGNVVASDYYISVSVDGYTVPEQINIKDCNITDYSFVNYFYSIEELALGYLNITDEELAVIDFEKLSGLKRLLLGGNEISDISQLKHLKKLEFLQLIGNNISDITPLKGLTNLKTLLLIGNNISDVTPLKGLTNLEKLELSPNEPMDISPLKILTKLKYLCLRGYYIFPKSEIEALRKALPNCEIEALEY